jgi:ABC-2 type transport system ATP-binding protein
MPAIEVRGVEKTYRPLVGRSRKALAGLDLEVRAGEVLGLIGPNGAGKTTLMTCLLGFQRPSAGTITVEGRAPDDLAVRARTGYLPERLGFDRDLTGREFLALHARLAGRPGAEVAAAVEEVAREVDMAGEPLGRRLRTYSRGMLQRIGLAQAVVGRPAIVFLDEPTSGLDPAGVAIVRRCILRLRGAGATVLLNSHQLPEVERVCDRVAFIENGRVLRTDSLHGDAVSRRTWLVRVRAGQQAAAAAALCAQGLEARARAAAEVAVQATEAEAEAIAGALVAAGVALRGLAPAGPELERLFVDGDA